MATRGTASIPFPSEVANGILDDNHELELTNQGSISTIQENDRDPDLPTTQQVPSFHAKNVSRSVNIPQLSTNGRFTNPVITTADMDALRMESQIKSITPNLSASIGSLSSNGLQRVGINSLPPTPHSINKMSPKPTSPLQLVGAKRNNNEHKSQPPRRRASRSKNENEIIEVEEVEELEVSETSSESPPMQPADVHKGVKRRLSQEKYVSLCDMVCLQFYNFVT